MSRLAVAVAVAVALALAGAACAEPRPYGGPIAVDHAGLSARFAAMSGSDRARAPRAPLPDAAADVDPDSDVDAGAANR